MCRLSKEENQIFKNNFTGVWLLHKFVLLSAIWQSDSSTHRHKFSHLGMPFPFRSPESTEQRFPALYSSFSLVTCFRHITIYMSIPISQFIPLPFSPLVPRCSFFTAVSISGLQIGSSVPFFYIPHICVNIRYFSLSELYHSV